MAGTEARGRGLRRIGLTGGIGSGKSTVGKMLERLGAVLLDSDAISRELTAAGGAAIGALRAEFGDEAIAANGALDRDRMRALAFADASAKARLEALLHPMIAAETARRAVAAGEQGVLVFDVPLLAESAHWRDQVERVLVVDCSASTQIERVLKRPGWTREAVERVIAQQAGRQGRRAIADAVLFNQGLTLGQLEADVHALWRAWGLSGA